MSNFTVCARFRPLSAREIDRNCIRSINSEFFLLKDEKEEEYKFNFDRVFYEASEQVDVYEFLALPIVLDAVNAVNGTIITYGQTGAGKTYTMEGPSISGCDERKKGLLPRVVDEIFKSIQSSEETAKYALKLSMVEIYMEKVRDLFDLSKDNIQIKENRIQGIILSGVTEIPIANPADALENLSIGISNRAVGETQMNMASSRSHCVYIFTIQKELTSEKRVKAGKLILVDLAGSEKVEKTGAEGKILDEAKTINKSLSALGNVVNALTCGTPGKAMHIPYRDSKLTRILQDALGGRSRTALLCCCSPGCSEASETLSTLRFGARAKHIKASPHKEEKCKKKFETLCLDRDDSRQRILDKLGEKLDAETVDLLAEMFIQEGIFFDPNSVEELGAAYEDVTSRTISSLHQAVEELHRENEALKSSLEAADRIITIFKESFLYKIARIWFLIPWVGSAFHAINEYYSYKYERLVTSPIRDQTCRTLTY